MNKKKFQKSNIFGLIYGDQIAPSSFRYICKINKCTPKGENTSFEVIANLYELVLYIILGCADVDGHFVMVGTERTVNCITKKCVSDRGFNILQTISEGKNKSSQLVRIRCLSRMPKKLILIIMLTYPAKLEF